jgi:hypothetical protein
MNVEIWTEAAQFLFLELINRNFFAVLSASFRQIISPSEAFFLTRSTLLANSSLEEFFHREALFMPVSSFAKHFSHFRRFLSSAELSYVWPILVLLLAIPLLSPLPKLPVVPALEKQFYLRAPPAFSRLTPPA